MQEKIAVIGGGVAGLAAGYDLAKAGFEVVIFEKEKKLGGLASGFKFPYWTWRLERTVHHIFANDGDILDLAKEVGFSGVFFKSPLTGSAYKTGEKYEIFALDTPFNFLKFPLLPLKDKARAAVVLAFLRFSPFLSLFERKKALDFLKKSMGEKANEILWKELFRKKFGKYAEKILLSFFWARIKKRTKKLGYVKGGFQAFIDYLEERFKLLGGKVVKGEVVEAVEKEKKGFKVLTESQKFSSFNKVIFALQLPLALKIGRKILPESFVKKALKINYLHAASLVLETREPIVKDFYWINVACKELPFMGIFQHTNFVDKKYYGGRHVCYIGWYCKEDDWIWQVSEKEVLKKVLPYLKAFGFKGEVLRAKLFKAPFAQPIFDEYFVRNKPSFKLPVPDLFFAGFELSYPYDRGTNYAIKVGREAARLVENSKSEIRISKQ